MKLTLTRESFLSAARLAWQATSTRDVKPILRCIHVIAADDRCTLVATDLEIGIRIEVRGVKVESPGEAMLPATLAKALAESTDEEMVLETDEHSVSLIGQFGKFDLQSMPTSEFPSMPFFDQESYHEIPGAALKEMIGKTAFAARACANGGASYSTEGALVEAGEKTLALVCLDGSRLAKVSKDAVSFGGHVTNGTATILPMKFVNCVLANIATDDELVKLTVRKNEALVKTSIATIYTRLVEGRFPNYMHMLPKETPFKATMPAGAFLAAIRQASVTTGEDTNRLEMMFDRKKLTIRSAGATTGKSLIELPLDFIGKHATCFNPKYLVDAMRKLAPDDQIEFKANERAAVITCGDFLYALAAMREPKS